MRLWFLKNVSYHKLSFENFPVTLLDNLESVYAYMVRISRIKERSVIFNVVFFNLSPNSVLLMLHRNIISYLYIY